MHRLKATLLRLFLILMSASVALGAVELMLRLCYPQPIGQNQYAYDPKLGYVLQPNETGHRFLPGVYDYTFTHDSQGLRISHPSRNSNIKTSRILFLGDSFTYGMGVNDDQTFPWLVQAYFNAKQRSVEVYNAGMPATGTDYALRYFEIRGKQYKPNITALCFFRNDYGDNACQVYYNVDQKGILKTKPISEALMRSKGMGIVARTKRLRNSALYNYLISKSHLANLMKRLISHACEKAFGSFVQMSPSRTADMDYSDPSNIRLTKIYLEKLHEKTKEAHSQLIVFYIPDFNDVTQYRLSHKTSQDEMILTSILKTENIPLISLTSIVSASKVPTSQLYYDPKQDGHWTAIAHRIAAQKMIAYLEKHLSKNPAISFPDAGNHRHILHAAHPNKRKKI